MSIAINASSKGELSIYRSEDGKKIASLEDFLELLGACPTPTIVIDKGDLDEAFFDLKSGLAGEFLQKISNYRRRLIVLGDYRALPGKALRDFIYESNKTGQVVFAPEFESAIELLR